MKMSLSFAVAAAVGGVMLFSAGCSSASAAKENKEQDEKIQLFSPETAPAARDAAGKFVDSFAAAMVKKDYALLPEITRGKISKDMFEQMVSTITERRGELKKHTFVTDLDQTIVKDFLWKFSFEKTPAEADKKAVRSEVIYLVRVAIDKGVPVVVGFGFSR